MLQRLLSRLARPRDDASMSRVDFDGVKERRRTSRRLCAALDDALERGHLRHADRIAHTAVRLAPEHPALAERLARLRLAQGRADQALWIIDGCFVRSASLRLLRAVCLLATGRIAEAHLDLRRWSAIATAPIDARLLLASLEWRNGDLEEVAEALRRNLRQLPDPTSQAMMMLLLVAQGRVAEARTWARRLRDTSLLTVRQPESELMIESLGLSEREAVEEPSDAHVDTLATELAACETVIPTLVSSLLCRFDPVRARLLREAVERALPELSIRDLACECLSQLDLLLGDVVSAARWADLALESNPMSASAAMLARRCRHKLASAPDVGVLARIGELAARADHRPTRSKEKAA